MSEKEMRFEDMLHQADPPEWLIAMHDHYAETGSFRTEDILRVFGDPRKSVQMASEEDAKAFFGITGGQADPCGSRKAANC